jgi:tetratricopeptide (TPR) repeat protein
MRVLLDKAIVVLVLVAVVAVPAGLAVQNLPQIWANTGSALSRITSLSARSLPADGAVVLSDEPFRLYAMENELRRAGNREKYLLIDTRSLESGAYHLHLQARHPNQWPKPAAKLDYKDRIAQTDLVQLMRSLAAKMPIYYLHPSFGYYFEFFELRPRGLIYQLRPLGPGDIGGPPMSAQELADADQFWQRVKTEELDRLIPRIPPAEFPTPGVKMSLRPVTLEMYVGRSYSQALNLMGTLVQRAGQLPKAADYYTLALKLDPMNPSAMLNAEYNQQLQGGKRDPLKLSDPVLKRIRAAGGSWDAILGSAGPVEEPDVCFDLARAFDDGNNPRQAAQCIERVLAYTPDNLKAQVILVGLLVRASLPDLALQRVTALRAGPALARLTPAQLAELAISEAWAHALRKDLPKAVQLLRVEIAKRPADGVAWAALFDVLIGANQMNEALAVVEEQIAAQPRNVQALVNGAVLKSRLGRPAEAVPLLNRALEINPKDEYALLNRALVQAAAGNLDGAEKDFEALQSGKGRAKVQVTLGLADIYVRKKRTKDAVRLYRQLEKTLSKESAEYRLVTDRLKQLD